MRTIHSICRPLTLQGLLGVLATTASALPGCVSDPDCGVCDPETLVLETIAGVNYAGKLVKLLGPACEGDGCPGAITSGKYFVETIMPCTETDAAIAAGRGADEWCKISPLVVDSGLQFIFNNLLDPISVELVRKQPGEPRQLEVFDWKTHIVHLGTPTPFLVEQSRPPATTSSSCSPSAEMRTIWSFLRLAGSRSYLFEKPISKPSQAPSGQRYRLEVPGLTLAPGETVHDVIAGDPARYAAAFWDACGMP